VEIFCLRLLGRTLARIISRSTGDDNFACQGARIIQAPKYIVAGAIARGDLQPILMDYASIESKPISVVYPQKRYLSAKVRVFIGFMTTLMEDLKRDGIVD
jgi:LysR family transcriptional regulator, regulator for bpeEF and oprC